MDYPPILLEYRNHRDALSVVNGVILKSERVLILHTLKSKILECLHQCTWTSIIPSKSTFVGIWAQDIL